MTSADSVTGGKCGAKTRSSGKCGRPAGWGTGHSGVGRCKLHGGRSPNAEMSGAVQLARREAAVMGQPLDIEPHVALIQCIRIAAGEVQYSSDRIAELDMDQAVARTETSRPLKLQKGAEDPDNYVTEYGGPGVNIWVEVRHRAMDRLVNYSKIALAAGVAERTVKIAEQQGQLLAQVIRGVLEDLGVADKPETAAIVRKHLTLVAA